ncbi:hypothetical protein GCM10023147_40630 [Tsukamurella soli]|uniref:Uncharacterized protein n=1 Tax=Tsukamurella soli TaxID=644556 RepID=A0ABP8K672_9ACTN
MPARAGIPVALDRGTDGPAEADGGVDPFGAGVAAGAEAVGDVAGGVDAAAVAE